MNIKKLALSKLRAALVHFGISVLLFLPFVYLIVFHWYPVPLFFTDGGWQGLRIMAIVDLVLGPTLTLLIFNPAKSRRALNFDFSFIALAQLAALTYGATTVHEARPWTVAYHDAVLHVITRDAYEEQEIEEGMWERLGDAPIYWAYTRTPSTPDETRGVSMFGMLKGTGPEALAFLYEPMGPHLSEMKKAALDMARVAPTSAALNGDYKALLKRHQGQELWFLPLNGYFADAIVGLDEEGRIVGTLYHEAPTLIAKPVIQQ